MARGQRAELDLIEDSGIGISSAVIAPPLKVSDIKSFDLRTIDTNEVILHWEKEEDFDVYDYVMKNEHIYSFMYGHRCNIHPIEKDIIQISTKELKWSVDKTVFYYVWGFPGPDFNIYTAENYLKSWAVTKEELIEYWREKENDLDERDEKRDN